jgi:hypothetical protein
MKVNFGYTPSVPASSPSSVAEMSVPDGACGSVMIASGAFAAFHCSVVLSGTAQSLPNGTTSAMGLS